MEPSDEHDDMDDLEFTKVNDDIKRQCEDWIDEFDHNKWLMCAHDFLKRSKCKWNTAGAVLVKKTDSGAEVSVSFGFGRVPKDTHECDWCDAEQGNGCPGVHAEMVAVLGCDYSDRGDSVMYISGYDPGMPCKDCMIMMIEAGVRYVVFEDKGGGMNIMSKEEMSRHIGLKIKDTEDGCDA